MCKQTPKNNIFSQYIYNTQNMKKKNIYTLLVLGLTIVLINCTNKNEADTKNENIETGNILKNDSSVLKVYLNENNEVLVNGEKVELDSLNAYISSRKNKLSGFYFSSYNAQDPEGPKELITVMEILTKQNLPLALFGDSTFTTTVQQAK